MIIGTDVICAYFLGTVEGPEKEQGRCQKKGEEGHFEGREDDGQQ